CVRALPAYPIRKPRWPRSASGRVPTAVWSARSREPVAMSRLDKTKAAYLAALRRLEEGRSSHSRLIAEPLSINMSTVCLEAGLSRNPPYAPHHRDVLGENRAAAERQRRGPRRE